jgi:exportin-T
MYICNCLALQWPQFFADILQVVQLGHIWTVDLYLRTLMALDSEVVDRHVIHTQEVHVRS